MNILFWTDGFWPRLGGIETMGLQLIDGMQQRGHRYTVLANKDHADWKDAEIYKNIPIQRFDFNAIVAKRDLSVIRAVQEYLERILKEFRPDIIHLYANFGGSALAFLLFAKTLRLPVVFTLHAPYLYENKLGTHFPKIAAVSDQICCVSQWVLSEIEQMLPFTKPKLRLIYNGLPLPEIAPSPLSFSPPTLLLFGRLSPEKGFATAIVAFSLLKPDAKLIIAGGGIERPRLEKQVDELNLRDSVEFTGVLTEEEVISTFNRASIVIVPSILESFGLVILEAMQWQRPVIASRVQGVPEVVADNETGLLVPAQDPIALSQAIQTLLKNPTKSIEMGLQGRKRALQFTLERNLLEHEKLYAELA